MGSDLRLTTTQWIAGEHALQRLSWGGYRVGYPFCSDDAAIEGKSIDAQTGWFYWKNGAARQD